MPRILLLADSHLGLDLPSRPRVKKPRRGHDFLENYARALEPAMKGEVDVVVHGGDVFDFPDAAADIAYQAYRPLVKVAELGIPVFVVPGNHERGRLPHLHLLQHPNVHVFARPRTVVLEVAGLKLALSGFPYAHRVRARFPDLLERTHWYGSDADVRLLCVHQCVEGATVGPANFTFRYADDVIRHSDVPKDFTAILSGHIHRAQVLRQDLRGKSLGTPVFYPGSIERTSSAENGEDKGYHLLNLDRTAISWDFVPLPTKPLPPRWTGSLIALRNGREDVARNRPAGAAADLLWGFDG